MRDFQQTEWNSAPAVNRRINLTRIVRHKKKEMKSLSSSVVRLSRGTVSAHCVRQDAEMGLDYWDSIECESSITLMVEQKKREKSSSENNELSCFVAVVDSTWISRYCVSICCWGDLRLFTPVVLIVESNGYRCRCENRRMHKTCNFANRRKVSLCFFVSTEKTSTTPKAIKALRDSFLFLVFAPPPLFEIFPIRLRTYTL